MSVFSLPEIARSLHKNPRTIRRWCEAGLVTGAFQTQGGHWRVRGESLAKVVAAAARATRGFARRRKPPVLTLSGKPVPQSALDRVERMKKNLVRYSPEELRVLAFCAEVPEHLKPENFVASPALAAARETALAWAMVQVGVSPDALAAAFGMNRRKFYRRFGKNLSSARWMFRMWQLAGEKARKVAFDEGHGLVETEDFDFDAIDERNGWREPVVAVA
jgi:AraC-like DNA-binding protein